MIKKYIAEIILKGIQSFAQKGTKNTKTPLRERVTIKTISNNENIKNAEIPFLIPPCTLDLSTWDHESTYVDFFLNLSICWVEYNNGSDDDVRDARCDVNWYFVFWNFHAIHVRLILKSSERVMSERDQVKMSFDDFQWRITFVLFQLPKLTRIKKEVLISSMEKR